MLTSCLFAVAVTQLSVPPPPKKYLAIRAPAHMILDGRLDKAAWKNAPFTDDFVDIEGDLKPKPRFRTRAKMLWDDTNLYIGAEITEPHIRATFTAHDSVIFQDNDFEVFIDPDDDGHLYSEMEMNALNTTWDLLLVHPYRTGGPAINGWEIKGMRTAVKIHGTLNNSRDRDRGWTLEIAIPWAGLRDISRVACPPKSGDQWRINFSRVEWQTQIVNGGYRTPKGTREDNWVWSPQGVVDMHRPDMWGVLEFSSATSSTTVAKPLVGWPDRAMLFQVWQAQQNFRQSHGHWAVDAQELGMNLPELRIWTTPTKFEAILGKYRVDESLLFSKVK